MHVKGLAVGTVRRQPGAEAERPEQVDQVEDERRLEITCEGVLHENDAAGTLLGTQGAQCCRRRNRDTALPKRPPEAHARQRRGFARPSVRSAARPGLLPTNAL